jgi:hypothetical protein
MGKMKKASLKSESERFNESIQIIRGKQAEIPMNVAIVGGGKACQNLLKILDKDRLSRLKMKILGVSDKNPKAPGILYAKDLKLFATTNLRELFTLEGLNVIIELTGIRRPQGCEAPLGSHSDRNGKNGTGKRASGI